MIHRQGLDHVTSGKDIEDQHGLGMSMNEALERFGQATRDGLADEDEAGTDLVPNGTIELVDFRGRAIRRICHNDEWMFSVVDVIAAITDSERPSGYWNDLRVKMTRTEGFDELYANIGKLPLPGADGKSRPSDVANAETLFRIIQSVPSPKAEPIKRWLAKVAYERIQEMQDPEIAIKRAIMTYQIKGYSDDWIEKRVRSIVANKELNREWQRRGIKKGEEFAMLTNIVAQETFGVGVARHKRIKGLSSQNLRDHMTDLELILTMLGETSATTIAVQRDTQGLSENAEAARAGGAVAGTARKQIERETGKSVVSSQNFLGSKKRTADPVRLTEKGFKTESE